MKKLLALIAFVSFVGIFSSCQEEEIAPQDQLHNTDKGVGSPIEDPGQWD